MSSVWAFAFFLWCTTRVPLPLCPNSSLLPVTICTDLALNPSLGSATRMQRLAQPSMLFSKSAWDLHEYLLTATLPEISGVGMGEDGPLIVPTGHKSHANHLSTRPSPHRLLTSIYAWDHGMLRWAIRACAFRFHPPTLALSHFISQSSMPMLPDTLLEPSIRTQCPKRG